MTGSAALSAYLLASRLAAPLAGPILRRRLARGKEDPVRYTERLGHASRSRPDGTLIWMHGASVGEAMSMLPLIDALLARSDAHVLVTTGTVTSAARLAPALPEHAFHQFVPVDTAPAVQRFLDHWSPDLAIWIESELWPRLISETANRKIPMALVNARLSERSFRRWRRAAGMARALLGGFGTILTQDQETAGRLAALGADASFSGNLKALVNVPEPDAETLVAFEAALAGRPVWLAASTHEGEEKGLLQAQHHLSAHAKALLILAPRHPERGDALAAMARAEGLSLARRSEGSLPGADCQVFLADTLGEMGLWYRLAPITFVGGSLVPRGGHTPFEPIACGSAVLHGRHVDNFATAYRALDTGGGAVCTDNSCVFMESVQRLLTDPIGRNRLATKATEIHQTLKPDVGRMADWLLQGMEAAS